MIKIEGGWSFPWSPSTIRNLWFTEVITHLQCTCESESVYFIKPRYGGKQEFWRQYVKYTHSTTNKHDSAIFRDLAITTKFIVRR